MDLQGAENGKTPRLTHPTACSRGGSLSILPMRHASERKLRNHMDISILYDFLFN
jgi:hypothetical protein